MLSPWFYRQSARTRNTLLFGVVFLVVLSFFVVWYRVRRQPQTHDEALTAAVQPLLRVGVAHPFLEGLVREIGSSYVSTIHVEPLQGEVNVVSDDFCSRIDIFFGISTVDGWMKDVCGNRNDLAIVFLDTYVQAQEKKIAGEAVTNPQSVYTDGYFWLSTQGGKNLTRAVAQVLSSADDVHKVSYLDAAYTTGHQLDDVYKKVRDRLYDMRRVWIVGWGSVWGALVDEYNGSIRRTIDVTYDPSKESEVLQSLVSLMRAQARPSVLVDGTFSFQTFSQHYTAYARRVAVLDPWGDFSDTWSFSAFVEQNLLRVAHAL